MAESAEEGLDKIGASIFAELKVGLVLVTEDLAGEGSRKAPVDEGHLKASVRRETDFKIAVIQGALQISQNVVAQTPYAFVQHEREDFNHPKGGQAKYLTGPLAEKAGQYQAFLAAAVERGKQKGGQ